MTRREHRERDLRPPHLKTEELLAMRDDEATAAARRHLDDCVCCQQELESVFQVRSRLRALPSLTAPRDLWPEIRAAAQSERRRRRHRRWSVAVGLLAASALLWIGVHAVLEQRAELREQAALDAYVAELREQSQLLEADLRELESRSRVLSAWRAETMLGVEDRLAELDSELARSRGPAPSIDVAELWRERVELQGALLNLHLAPVSSRVF